MRLREGAAHAQLVCRRPGVFRVARWNCAAVASASWRMLRRRKLPVGPNVLWSQLALVSAEADPPPRIYICRSAEGAGA